MNLSSGLISEPQRISHKVLSVWPTSIAPARGGGGHELTGYIVRNTMLKLKVNVVHIFWTWISIMCLEMLILHDLQLLNMWDKHQFNPTINIICGVGSACKESTRVEWNCQIFVNKCRAIFLSEHVNDNFPHMYKRHAIGLGGIAELVLRVGLH